MWVHTECRLVKKIVLYSSLKKTKKTKNKRTTGFIVSFKSTENIITDDAITTYEFTSQDHLEMFFFFNNTLAIRGPNTNFRFERAL